MAQISSIAQCASPASITSITTTQIGQTAIWGEGLSEKRGIIFTGKKRRRYTYRIVPKTLALVGFTPGFYQRKEQP